MSKSVDVVESRLAKRHSQRTQSSLLPVRRRRRNFDDMIAHASLSFLSALLAPESTLKYESLQCLFRLPAFIPNYDPDPKLRLVGVPICLQIIYGPQSLPASLPLQLSSIPSQHKPLPSTKRQCKCQLRKLCVCKAGVRSKEFKELGGGELLHYAK